ncbi:MAG: TrwH protein [Acidiphilium sp.]|nr:TrwH protein [Acidiphilium sp.]MDD4937155.1 TrwH protein [Acidiphilium sp.]
MVKLLLFAVLCASLAGCATGPVKPRMPDWSQHVPINRTIPPEVQNGVAK